MKKVIKITVIIGLVLFIVFSIFAVLFIGNIMKESKNVSLDKEKLLASTSQLKIYDDGLNLISNSSTSGQKLVKLDELNDYTINAFIAIEDKDFYKHNGLNYKRIAKAMLNNIKSMSFKEGASTISQQLIKNTHLTNEKTIKRKIKEMVLTKKLEGQYDKNTILETYLNVIYFGEGCYGIEEASEHYFNKSATELSLTESCLLASLIKSPAYYSPTVHPENALKRRNLVLSEMCNDGYITSDEYQASKAEQIDLNIKDVVPSENDLYFKSVVKEACDILNITEKELAVGGYVIKTYYNQDVQNGLKDAITTNDLHINSYGNTNEELGIVINNKNGGIQAFYGKSEYPLLGLKRQPGSAIKPALVYAPALESGYIQNCTQILDEKVDFNGYSPNNVGNTFSGYISIRDAVAKSLNIPAVKIMDYLTVKECKKFAEKLGITFSKQDNGLALALGGFTDGITLQQLTQTYLPYSNEGKMITSGFIREISTTGGVVVYRKNEDGKEVMGSDTAYLMTDLLLSGVEYGTSKRLSTLPYQIAGKTGTVAVPGTNLNTDAYSIAYTTEHTAGIWIGNYTNKPEFNMEGKNNGGTYATSHLKSVFENLYETHYPSNFAVPDSIDYANIDVKELTENHKIVLANADCPERYVVKEIFAKRYMPTEYSTLFTEIEAPTLDVENNNESATLTLNCKDYYNYEIYCNGQLLKEVTDHSGLYNYKHENLIPNTKYSYYVKVKGKISDNFANSNEVTIVTKEKYVALIDNQIKDIDPNLSWYFY